MLLYAPQYFEMTRRRIFPSSFVRFFQVFLSAFSFLVSILSLVLIEMSHIEAAIDGFMNCIRYLRDINEPFRKFVRIQTKWNDRKTQNEFMSSLRAH